VIGTVHLVGAGPGAADLLTLRAARVLERAEIVFHDALVSKEVLALAKRAVRIAVGKRCGKRSTAQRFINKRLVDAARRHRSIVRLKGGDPLLFGRAQEEIDALRAAGVPFEIVPGISAAFAATAELGASLSVRGIARSVVFATPRIGDDQPGSGWVDAVLAADTAALYMAGRHAREIAAELIAHGGDARSAAVLVSSATLPGRSQRALTLGELACAELPATDAPTLLLLGAVYARCLSDRQLPGAPASIRSLEEQDIGAGRGVTGTV
jgi:uroporphyrin-III C-methyltransferase